MKKFTFTQKEDKKLSFIDQYNWKEINFSSHKKKTRMCLKKIIKQKLPICTLQCEKNKTCI